MQALTEAQTKFLYFLDVVGTTVARARDLAGLTVHEAASMLDDPDVEHARKVQRDLSRHRTGFTREDVTEGIHDAVQQARLLADPLAQIRGWVEIARINGLDVPRKVEIEITHVDANSPVEHLKRLSTVELAKLVDESHVIDVDFYETDRK